MKCEIRIVSGGRAGQRDVFEKSYIGVGRHALSDVRFDAEKDVDASARHAAIVWTGEAYVVRDLGSTNGTFVNGQKISGDRVLADGDVIRCGARGPEVGFHLVQAQAETVMPAMHLPEQAAAPRPGPVAAPAPQRAAPPGPAPGRARSVTSVLRAQIRREASRVRAVTVVLGMVLVGAVGLLLWQGGAARQERASQQSALDSLGRELVSLRAAAVAADSEVARLQRLIEAARGDPARLTILNRQYTQAVTRQRNIATAQSVDYTAIRNANDRAIAIIYVRFSDTTQMWTGTAFSVSHDGVMITNRHVITNDRGERPRDIAVQFSGSTDVHPARLVGVAPDADLAVVRLESAGPFPAVAGIAPDAAGVVEGAPIALIGFPGGSGDVAVPRATLVTGTVSRIVPDSLLQLDAFSGTGASGSPIFDRDGRVIGVEYGGIRESGGRIILGLPIRRAMTLIPS